MNESAFLEVSHLRKTFSSGGTEIRAVDDVSFAIRQRESVGLVGESGCGKTTTARCLLKLESPDGGEIVVDGRPVARLREHDFRQYRKRIQMVFQDPVLSLNPLFTVHRTLEEPLRLHRVGVPKERAERIVEIMSLVNLDPAFLRRYPQQLSGGQCQRVGIARAIATNPELVVLDEPTSWLDMSTRVQIIRLLLRLQEQIGMAYLFISHDLSTIRHTCQRVVVMYLGRIVETGPVEQVFDAPRHPYTYALLSAIPIPDPTARRERLVLAGEPAGPAAQARGCAFASRCPHVRSWCREERPELRELTSGRQVACHFAEEIDVVRTASAAPVA